MWKIDWLYEGGSEEEGYEGEWGKGTLPLGAPRWCGNRYQLEAVEATGEEPEEALVSSLHILKLGVNIFIYYSVKTLEIYLNRIIQF